MRTHPIVVGISAGGELIWRDAPMPEWKMRMFRVKYYGDFMAFWMKRHLYEMTGFEPNFDIPSMDISKR